MALDINTYWHSRSFGLFKFQKRYCSSQKGIAVFHRLYMLQVTKYTDLSEATSGKYTPISSGLYSRFATKLNTFLTSKSNFLSVYEQ